MNRKQYDIGVIGLGVMGRNLLLNMADHGYTVTGYDHDLEQVKALRGEAAARSIRAAKSLDELTGLLSRPRTIMLMVPAGHPVDSVIGDLAQKLEPGDLIIDGGNSHFKDTDHRMALLDKRGLFALGVGISGGDEGARRGPCLMPGGAREAYERVRPLMEDIAAHVRGEPCVAYMGPGSAGHYVKMIHNAIEYGLMQLLAETYDLMKRGVGLDDDELHHTYERWTQGELSSYLLEVTSSVFLRLDPKTGKRLIDVILDEAKQKGTGMWASQDAMELQVPTPTVDTAVAMRNISLLHSERAAASTSLEGPPPIFRGERETVLEHIRRAFYASTIITFAQGMAQLRSASQVYGYNLDLEAVTRIWRGGCIIRAALVEDLRRAYKMRPELRNILLDPQLGQRVADRQRDLRAVVCLAAGMGLPAPAHMATLSYLDSYRSARLPANLIQALRDYFGAHSYERVDARGSVHTRWDQR